MVDIPDAAVRAAAKCYAERVISINDTFTSLAREMLTAAIPHLQPVDVEAVTKPVTNIESRTPKEVFDIMCDRIRSISDDPALKTPQHDNN